VTVEDRHETLESLHSRFLFHRVAWGHGCSEMGPGGDCHPLGLPILQDKGDKLLRVIGQDGKVTQTLMPGHFFLEW
jgi:hypothetical protein